MRLYLVRHGETQWNVERRLQGHRDSPLTIRGLGQVQRYATLLRAELADIKAVQVCASPLGRTRQTASMLLEALGVPRAQYGESELLMERACGSWEGLQWADIEARDPDARSRWREWTASVPHDGESLAQVHARAKAWLSLPRSLTTPTIVVTHGVMSRVFRGAYLGLDDVGTMTLEGHDQETIYVLDESSIRALR